MKNQVLMALLLFNVGFMASWLVLRLMMDVDLLYFYLISTVVSLALGVVGYFVGGSMS